MDNEIIVEAVDIINKLRQIAERLDPTAIPINLQLDIDLFLAKHL